jgi:hypothetical protein
MGKEMQKKEKRGRGQMIKAIAVLLRNTTWRCGRIERLIIGHLQTCLRRNGVPRTSIKDMIQHFKLYGRRKTEFYDALRRLEQRRIIRLKLDFSNSF